MSAPFVLAVPSKGRLQENAEGFFARAGLTLSKPGGARDYRGPIAGLDNVEIAYVEFYRNGQLLTTVKDAPYTFQWDISQGGQQTFYAVAYDSAGNTVQSDAIRVNIQR